MNRQTAHQLCFRSGRRRREDKHSIRNNGLVDHIIKNCNSALGGAESTLLKASGMCASTVLFMALVPAGGHLVTMTDCYRKTWIFVEAILPKMGIIATGIDTAYIGRLKSVFREEQY
ncbi:cystathionine gamma-synthase 1, chloroplastic-like [Primulina eburnea]|uniref:cystathionine gamma-synthase 1, chloroplastic-like n=1 Tax=Primulina eburnea TaxID=1245227 RepID=UPI003C6C6700